VTTSRSLRGEESSGEVCPTPCKSNCQNAIRFPSGLQYSTCRLNSSSFTQVEPPLSTGSETFAGDAWIVARARQVFDLYCHCFFRTRTWSPPLSPPPPPLSDELAYIKLSGLGRISASF